MKPTLVPIREKPEVQPLYFAEKPNPYLLQRNHGVSEVVGDVHKLHSGVWCVNVVLERV